jgi:hypothetical protein
MRQLPRIVRTLLLASSLLLITLVVGLIAPAPSKGNGVVSTKVIENGEQVLHQLKQDAILATYVLPFLTGRDGMFLMPGQWEEEWKVTESEGIIIAMKTYRYMGSFIYGDAMTVTCNAEERSKLPIPPGLGNCDEVIEVPGVGQSIARYFLSEGGIQTLLQINGGAYALKEIEGLELPGEVSQALDKLRKDHPDAQLGFGVNIVLVSSAQYEADERFANPLPTRPVPTPLPERWQTMDA